MGATVVRFFTCVYVDTRKDIWRSEYNSWNVVTIITAKIYPGLSSEDKIYKETIFSFSSNPSKFLKTNLRFLVSGKQWMADGFFDLWKRCLYGISQKVVFAVSTTMYKIHYRNLIFTFTIQIRVSFSDLLHYHLSILLNSDVAKIIYLTYVYN